MHGFRLARTGQLTVNRTRLPALIDFLVLPVLYYVGAKVGMLTVMPEGIAILWPPNSVLLAALLRFQGRRYAIFATLAVGAEIAADLPTFSPLEGLLFGLTNVMETTIAYLLLARWRFDVRFSTLGDLSKFVLAGPIVGALAAAFCGAAIYSHFRGTQTGYMNFMRIWWFGDALGLMMFTPLLLGLWRPAGDDSSIGSVRLRTADGAVISAAFVALGLLVASRDGRLAGVSVDPVLMLPFILFIAVRFGLRSTALATVATGMIVVVMTVNGRNPFGMLSPSDNVIQTQVVQEEMNKALCALVA